ncbi:hypothetical protein BDV39DRAFT_184284 [Aspergillus sergii]|uniref:Uncharacterized protein n=1 Tax=Aspergillus sergii TaxID=1034303 RepID=A0A5N6WNI4_9EURO|nr:hypothetical protein BDV39DRAFT_184284 [Aspergillus sergii]
MRSHRTYFQHINDIATVAEMLVQYRRRGYNGKAMLGTCGPAPALGPMSLPYAALIARQYLYTCSSVFQYLLIECTLMLFVTSAE